MKLMYLISRAFCGLTLLCAINTTVSAQSPSYTSKIFPVLDDNINGFWEYLPRDYEIDVNKNYPLLVYLHGAGDQGSFPYAATLDKINNHGPALLIKNGNFPETFTVGGNTFSFIVISPQIKDGVTGLTSTITPSTVDAVIEYAKRTYRVDESRIYLVGMSMGGGGTWIYASSELGSKKLAAIIPATGAYDLSTIEADRIASENVAVLATHNVVDNVVLIDRTVGNLEKIYAFSPAATPAPVALYWDTPGENNPAWNDGAHNVWSRTFEDLAPGSSLGGNLTDSLGMNAYEWLLGNQNLLSTVPLTWEDFMVRAGKGLSLLNWKVSNQLNVKEFVIEKSGDNVNFISIASVNADTSSRESHEYRYTDLQPYPKISYYRIKQVDNDNKYSYSTIRKLSSVNKIGNIAVFPNPFISFISLQIPNLSPQTITIRVSDVQGRIFRKQQLSQWSNPLTIDKLDLLTRGVYMISISGEQGKILFSDKIIKQ